MEHLIVPAPLYAKLGEEASEGLVDMFGHYHQFATDRFERKVTEETSALRVEMHQGFSGLRVEMHQGFSALRVEMHQGDAALRQEMAAMRVEWIKWSFLFWVGHLGITLGVVAYMLGAP